jgi:predicted acetyltransferase
VSWEIRPCSSVDELNAAFGPIFHFFGRAPTPEGTETFARILPLERMLGAWEDGTAIGGAGAFPLELTIPGGTVAAAGVTVVGVLPTRRRRGVLASMMRAQLDAVHERGEPVAYLWASDDRIYGRYGYGMASMSMTIDVESQRGAFAAPVEQPPARLVTFDEALETIPPIYDRVRPEFPGMFARTRDWWETRALADLEWRRAGGGELMRVVVGDDAYALYRYNQNLGSGVSTGHIRVVEAVGATPEATAAVWRYLFDLDWIERVKADLLPLDHPLFLLVAEPRRLNTWLRDGFWVRLVDVGAALSARSFQGDGQVVLEVTDAFCPWNEGRWTCRGERTEAKPELRLDVRELGSVYLGGFTFAQLARARRVEELVPGAVARADALFATDRAPWCPEIF